MKVTYPLKEITDENVKDKLGSNNLGGKYPIGNANIWHGGFHLETKKDTTKKVLAIADGRIIAYRFSENEKEVILDEGTKEETKRNYSSSFVLIQHDYESPEGLKMSFYSVYHHLLSKTGIAAAKLPKFLTETETKLKSNLRQEIHGLKARAKANYSTVEFALPKGAIVTLDDSDTLDTHWSRTSHKKSKYKKVYYTDLQDTTHYDIYIPTSSKYVAVDKNNSQQLTIIRSNTGKTRVKRAEDGEHLREAGSIKGAIITVVKSDTVVTSIEKKEKYTKVKFTQENGIEQEGYIYTKNLEEKEIFDKKILDQIQASDIKVKAGEHIGYIGKYGIEKNKDYTATHVEVFTTEKIDDFLTNKENDGKDKKHFAKIAKGTKLKPYLSVDIDLKKNTPIKILKIKDEYAKVKITSITAVLYRDKDINDSKNKIYTIKDFNTVNKAFNGLIDKGTTFTTGQVKRNTTKKWDEDLSRKVTFYPKGYNEKYWIAISKIAKVETGLCTNEQGQEVMGYEEISVGSISKTEYAITKGYLAPPDKTITKEEIINKEHIANIGKFKKVKENKDKIWYKVALTYTVNEKEETKKGWLLEKDIKEGLFSAYQWEKFGFEKLNAGSEFVYSLSDMTKDDITSDVPEEDIAPFLKKVWDIVDTDKNKKLSTLEIKLAYDEPEQVAVLSKLVCTHKNEWAYDIDTIKAEAQEVYDTAMGKNPSKKLQKQVESRILVLETKMTELMFWEEAKNLAYTGDINTKLPPRKFPSTSNVHFFHPIAWIRQMKLINGNDAPWMKFVLEEAIKYKGIKETVNPLAKAVQEKYHTYIGHPEATSATSWCASFASWSLHQAEFDNPKSWSSQAFFNHVTLQKCDAQYGAIAVFTNCKKDGSILKDANKNTHGHVSFVFGIIRDNYYACLGGNQGDKLKVTKYDCSGNVFLSYTDRKGVKHYKKFRHFYIPKKHKSQSTGNLKTYSSAKEANKELLKITIKESKNGEST